MSNFNGASNHNLDSKGRVFVPKRIQQRLPLDSSGARWVVLSPGMDGCVNLFTPEGWAAAKARLQTQPFADQSALAMQRFVFGNTFDVQLDSSNRVLIPERLRGYAKLDGELSLVGVEERVEIWTATAWAEYEARALSQFDQLAPAWAGGAPQAPLDSEPRGGAQ